MKTKVGRTISFIVVVIALGLWTYFSSQNSGNRVFILAHNLNVDHPVHKGMMHFADSIEKQSNGEMRVKIYADGQLGSERETIELLQLGAVAISKVSSLSLENFAPLYQVVNLPFIFRDQKHYYEAVDSEVGEKLMSSSRPQKIIGLAFYTAGARSFYGHKPIMRPEDLKGMKMRTMSSPSAVQMMKLFGGSATPMAYPEVYSALQQNVIDGAENNVTALALQRHGEVAKVYSLDEHIMAPDMLIMSAEAWDRLSPEQQIIFRRAADESKVYQRQLWEEMTAKYLEEVQSKMGVKVVRPEKEPFLKRVSPLHDELAKVGPEYRELIDKIKSM